MYRDEEQAASGERSQLERGQALALFPTAESLAGALDHTLLRPEATDADVRRLATEAAEHRFACAMVHPYWVRTVSLELNGSGVRTGTVVGFPHGASLKETKQAEALAVVRAGARDIDMVLSIGAARSGFWTAVADEIEAVARIVHGGGATLKVILETCVLSAEQKQVAAELCINAEVDFVKTSTGFSTGGATVADVRLLRSLVGNRCGVKASGGIRSLADTVRMASAGANRIGATASVSILHEYLDLREDAQG